MNLLNAALHYAGLGYPVFPCWPKTKKPITEHGFHNATTDAEQIKSWWAKHPNANVAMPTGAVSGTVVLDVDPRHGGDVGFDELVAENATLPDAPESLTSGGGRHIVLKHPGGHIKCDNAGKLAPGVDVKGDGGYVMLPPSLHPDGSVYEWELSSHIADVPPPPCPAWLAERLAAGGEATRHGGTGAASDGNVIPEGQRNDALARLAGGMRRMGMAEPEILAALAQTNDNRCNPPLSQAEVSRITASIARYEPDQITVALIEDHCGQMERSPAPDDDKPGDPGPFPAELVDCGGLLAEIIAFNNQTAFKPQPVLALGAAIALLGTITGRKVADEYNTRTNVYCLGVCGSGGGKERPRLVNKEILFLAGLDRMAGPEGLASHAGLITAVHAQPSILFQLDEIGRLLKTLSNPNRSPHLYHIATVLMRLFTCSNSVYIGDAYADKKRNKTINQPNACLYGTTVPQSLYEGLTAESVTDGSRHTSSRAFATGASSIQAATCQPRTRSRWSFLTKTARPG